MSYLCLVVIALFAVNVVQSFKDIDLSTCAASKRCFRSKEGCSASTCQLAASWRTTGDQVEIELAGDVTTKGGYVSIGFSVDNLMGNDSVVGCFVDNGMVAVLPGYNVQKPLYHVHLKKEEYPKDYIEYYKTNSQLGGKFDAKRGRLYCRFRVKLRKPRGSSSRVFDLAVRKYYVLLARGGKARKGGLSKHFPRGTAVSPRRSDLTLAGQARALANLKLAAMKKKSQG
jgi:hypothetical protein